MLNLMAVRLKPLLQQGCSY